MAGSGGVGLLSAAIAPYPAAMDIDFSEDEIRRYSRHILLREVGGKGQQKLKAARVLVVGAGGRITEKPLEPEREAVELPVFPPGAPLTRAPHRGDALEIDPDEIPF